MAKDKSALILERAAEKAAKILECSAADGVNKLANAVEKATQKISDSEINASKRIADDAANAVKVLNVKNAEGGSDHDFQIKFSAEVTIKLDNIIKDIKDIKSGTSIQIADHEARIKKLENKTSSYFITITLYSIAVAFMIGLLIFHIIQK